MAFPIYLDRPPVVTQTAQTCWAAAFESWADANAQLTGTDNQVGRQLLINWFESGNGLTFESGRATPQGMSLMAGLGFMRMLAFRAANVTTRLLGRLLEEGYLYVVYFRRPGTPAHAVVCYGVDDKGIYVMDPMPGRGLEAREGNFFMTMSEGSVVIGLPMLVGLSRSIGRSLQDVGPR
jgi:hypothetical protein